MQDTSDVIPPDEYSHTYSHEPDRKRRMDQEMKLCLTVGNPPFGKNACKAIQFFNKAANFSSVIAFVVPRTFCKAGTQDRLDRHFFLAAQRPMEDDAFVYEGKAYNVPCVFQVWINMLYPWLHTASITNPLKIRPIHTKLLKTDDFTFVNCDGAPDLAMRRVGVNAGRIFTFAVSSRSSSSHLFIKITPPATLQDVLGKLTALNLESAEAKYQTAGCPSISKHDLCWLYTHQE
jgi:hypothetical protein